MEPSKTASGEFLMRAQIAATAPLDGNSLPGFIGPLLFGVILLATSIFGYQWNEKRAEQSLASLELIRANLVDGRTNMLAKNEGKFVHVQGVASVESPAVDTDLKIQFPKAALIKRRVTAYQWYEKSSGENKKYERGWFDFPVEDKRFAYAKAKGKNPNVFPVEATSFGSDSISISGHPVASELLVDALPMQRYLLDKDQISKPRTISGTQFHLYAGELKSGRPGQTNVGDIKVSYDVIKPSAVSIIAFQQDGMLMPYDASGESIYFAVDGLQSAESMLLDASSGSAIFAWFMRIICALGGLAGLIFLVRGISLVAGHKG